MTLAPVRPLGSISDAVVSDLRNHFTTIGFTEASIGAAERIAPGAFDRVRLPLVHWTLAKQGDPATVLTRLFAYSGEIDAEIVSAALGPELSTVLWTAGVIGPVAEGSTLVRANFRIMPLDGMWFLSDEPWAGGDAVMGPGPTTLDLVRLLPRTFSGSALDLGCGAGTLAIAAAKRGATVVIGTDVNERAMHVARFNARLNDVQVEFRVGDLAAPVATERFDLVVAQPPYVIQPPDTPSVTYLHGGEMGDELALRFVTEIAVLLAPNGRAMVVFDSPVRPKQPLHTRVRKALGNAPLDLLTLAGVGPGPDFQAIAYASLESGDLGPNYATALLRYRQHLEALGVREVSHALVVLRAGEGTPPGGKFTITLPVRSISATDGAGLDAVFAALDLASCQDDLLRRATVRVSTRARFIEERPRPDPNLEPKYSVRFSPGGVGADQELSEAVIALLSALDSSKSVEDAVVQYAITCGATADEMRPRVVAFVRENLARGLLQAG